MSKSIDSGVGREDVVERIQERLKLSKTDARAVVTGVFDMMIETLSAGRGITIAGFGQFGVVDRAARTVRVPTKTEAVWQPSYRVVSFRPSKALRDKIK